MTLTDKVTNLELSKQLDEAGIKIESEYHWVKWRGDEWELHPVAKAKMSGLISVPAPLSVELGEVLPWYEDEAPTAPYKYDGQWANLRFGIMEKTEPNARAKCLLHYHKEGLL